VKANHQRLSFHFVTKDGYKNTLASSLGIAIGVMKIN
jgi:hypothetical protein